MRVLLVNTNRARLPDPIAPIGLATVASSLLTAGHDVEICDLCFADNPVATVGAHTRRFSPDVVGVTIRNIDNTAFPHTESYVPFVAQVVAAFRASTAARIVLGGSGFSLMARALLERLDVELGVEGEAERSLV